jgi:hypothetical protein
LFDHTHYVPILKGKEGEYSALRELTRTIKDGLTPLIEIPSIPYDFENDVPAKTVDAHLAKVVQKIETCWGADRPVSLDLDWISPSERMADGSHPLKYIFDNARDAALHAIPVTGINRPTAYQDAVKDANDTDHFGLCIRLEPDDLNDWADLQVRLNDLLAFFGLFAHDIDVVVDFESIASPTAASPIAMAMNSVITNLPLVRDWRTLTFAASAFPQDLSNMSPRTITPVSRTEWLIWQSLAVRRARLIRLPTFGDYAISHPIPNEIDPRLMKMSAQLRYTADTEWFVFKARNVRDYGYEQFNDICRALITKPYYKGAAFSWGDNAINLCAVPGANPGNATTWRRIGTNHHLTFVVDQIANVPGL